VTESSVVGSIDGTALALDAETLCEAFQRTARAHAAAPAIRLPDDELVLTWAEYAERVERLAGALAALGVERGETVAMLVHNRPEALLLDAACLHIGAAPCNLYTTSSPEQLEYLIEHSGARIALAEAPLAPRLPALEHLFVLDGDVDGGRAFDELLEIEAPADFDFAHAWSAARPDDVVTLIYTSGTTGPPKGVEITHANVLGSLRAYHQLIPYVAGGRLMSYLPMAHLADRLSAQYPALATGSCVTVVAEPARAAEALRDCRPTTWCGMPRVWEKMKAAVEARLAGADPATIRAALGLDEAQCLYSGGAPIAPEVLQFFVDLDLPILEIYGQTETSAAGTANRPDDMRVGSVGKALPGTEVRLADDGELLIRGPIVMRGYRNDPEKTAETIDADGWVHTGDIGEVDEDGFFRIVDRKKELIINAMGKNMSPTNIENVVKGACPLVGSAVAIGDRRPYVTALLVLEPDAVRAFADERGLAASSMAELAADPQVFATVEAGVREANERLSRVEQVKRFKVLGDEWLPGGEELTPTMKLRRKPIAEKYAAAIEDLYAPRD
jgi:long-chain acyl-CoA synthetase